MRGVELRCLSQKTDHDSLSSVDCFTKIPCVESLNHAVSEHKNQRQSEEKNNSCMHIIEREHLSRCSTYLLCFYLKNSMRYSANTL